MRLPLPADFADLEPWLDWAQPSEYLRNRKRSTATMMESQDFYDVMQLRCGDDLSYLDGFALGDLDPHQIRLLTMCLALTEVSISIEMYGEPQPKYVFPIERFVPVHDCWPLGGTGPDLEKNGLTAVHCGVWNGFIFINLAAMPEETLEAYLAPVSDHIDKFDFEGFTPAFSYRIEKNVNWKTLQEAQLEGGHLPFLHEKMLARAVKTDCRQYRHTSIELHGPHGALGSPPPGSFVPPPTALLASRFGTGAVQAFAAKANKGDEGYQFRGSFDFWHPFPNFFIGLLDGLFFSFNIWPISVDESIWEIKGYYPPVKTASEPFARAYSKLGLRDPMMEDCFIHELIAAQLKSGANPFIHSQDEEMMVRDLSNGVDRCVRGLE